MARRTRTPTRPEAAAPVAHEGSPCQSVKGGCQLADLFKLLGRAHVLDILHIIMIEEQGARRFVDIQHRLHISPNTLSDRLKELVEAGLLTRTAYNEIPPRVDYAATQKALELKPVFATLIEWAQRNNLSPEPGTAAAATA